MTDSREMILATAKNFGWTERRCVRPDMILLDSDEATMKVWFKANGAISSAEFLTLKYMDRIKGGLKAVNDTLRTYGR